MSIVPRKCLIGLLVCDPLRFLKDYRWPLFILVLGAFLDGVSTYQFLSTVGPDGEVHPVQRLVFTYLPPMLGILFAKACQVIAAVFVAAWWQPWCKWLLLITGVLYILAAMSNYFHWL
jgi:hypothetical protein